eukprot:gene4804-5990_t
MTSSINQIKNSLKLGNLKVSQVVQQYLNRINDIGYSSNVDLNCFISKQSTESLTDQINQSQLHYQNGTQRKLEGIPIAVKDNFSTNQFKTTCASNILKNYIPTFDSTVVSLLKNEGAIIIGKTNMDEFAMGSSSTNGCFGSVVNPWSVSNKPEDLVVSGGSSGGSAVAVASGMCVASMGSDTGGSIRQPASYCGVVGFKPSYGLISRYGLVAYASSLDTPGVFTKSIDDAALLLDVLIKRDHHDSTSIEFGDNNSNNSIYNRYQNLNENQTLKNLVFGIPMDYLVEELDPEILGLWKEVVEEIEKQGGKVVPVTLKHTKYALPSYYILATSEASSNLSRFDGIRYGSTSANIEDTNNTRNLKQLYTDTRTENFGEEVKKRILLGTMALSRGSYDNFYKKAQEIRRLVSDDFKNVFTGSEQQVDVLITPTVPSTAFKLNSDYIDPIHMYINDIMTIPANLAGLPSVSIPLKLSSKSNLPMSVQLISNRLNDVKLLFAAQSIMNLDKFSNFSNLKPHLIK